MIVKYLDFFIGDLLPELLENMDSMYVAPGVSFLGLTVAVILLGVVIGSILMRV